MVSLTCRPMMPPLAFTSAAHSSYPFLKAWPSSEKSPVRESDAPIEIGAVEAGEPVALALVLALVLVLVLGLLLLLLLLLPLLVQAARTLTESTATAPMAKTFRENQGGVMLTPGSSFRDHHSSGSSPSDTSACSLSRVIPADSASCAINVAKSTSP